MAHAGRVASSNRAFLKVPLQNVTSGEGIVAECAHIWPITGIYMLLSHAEELKREWTYVAACGASDASHGDMSYCSLDKDTFRSHP